VRFTGSSLAVVFLMGGESVGLLFAGCLGLAFLILAAASVMARLESRLYRLRRTGRRR
jgi:hypothetical protein